MSETQAEPRDWSSILEIQIDRMPTQGAFVMCDSPYHRLIMDMPDLEFDDVNLIPTEQFDRYIDMRLDGQSHSIALMLATRSFPGVKSDSILNEGMFSGDNGRHPDRERWLRAKAEKAGVSTQGSWYCSGLARFAGDPKAWVSSAADIRRVARENNMTVDGYVQQEGHEVAPMPDIKIDPKIVHRETAEICSANPGSNYQDVFERVRDLRSGKVSLAKPE